MLIFPEPSLTHSVIKNRFKSSQLMLSSPAHFVQWLSCCGSCATKLLICRFLLKIVQVQARVSDSIHPTITNFLYPRLEGTIFSWAQCCSVLQGEWAASYLSRPERDEKKSWSAAIPNSLWSAWQSSTTISSLDLARTECKATHCSGRALLKPGLGGPERVTKQGTQLHTDTSWHVLTVRNLLLPLYDWFLHI